MDRSVKPIDLSERISSLDILRGIALLGILLVNTLGFNASFFDFGGFYNNLGNEYQQHFYTIFISLTADKFIFLFSFLFGYGIYLQFSKFKLTNRNFNHFFTRRMLVLMLIGIFHLIFLWAGDVLFSYSIAGLILLSFHKLKTKWLLPIAIIFYFFIGFWLLIGIWIPLPNALSSTCTECLTQAKIIYTKGNYLDCLKLRWQEYISFRNINAFYYLPKIIGISLFGFIAAKNNLHSKISSQKIKWTIILISTSTIGAITYFNYEKIVDVNSPFANAVYMTGYEFMNLFIAFSYILLTLLFTTNKRISQILKPIALMGRMSLTNYISQSIILSFLFYGWGIGLFGQTNITFLVAISFSVYAFQLILNSIYFKFYKQGPIEKFWRRFSYD